MKAKIAEIVSSSNRQILELEGFDYVYIPLTGMERYKYAPNTINPCWRISIAKED